MPRYDFKCDYCDGSVVELHLAFEATDKPVCDRCGYDMTKVMTPPSVHFKGGGWGGS
jgi:putative FmdB family regulatory protein